jgi:hypothetical protein
MRSNEAVEKLSVDVSKYFLGGHSTHPKVMIVDCSALYEVDFLTSQFRFFETEFFYSVNVKLRGWRSQSLSNVRLCHTCYGELNEEIT